MQQASILKKEIHTQDENKSEWKTICINVLSLETICM